MNMNMTMPFLTIVSILSILIFQIPETPIWLLSKNRTSEALMSLQWLRGWVSPKAVQTEFLDLQRYREMSNGCENCEKLAIRCPHPMPSTGDKMRDLLRRRTLLPMLLVSFLYVIVQFSGISSMRPFMVQILETYGVPISASNTTVFLGLLGIVANIVLLLTVRLIGKRRIYLWSLTGAILSCFSLGKMECGIQSIFLINYFFLYEEIEILYIISQVTTVSSTYRMERCLSEEVSWIKISNQRI